MEMLRLEHVSKAFGGNQVIDDLSFSVSEHMIYGFIGQNGAGKTTTMKMILGLLEMDQGKITVQGERVRYGQNRTNCYIGYLPDVPEFYSYMTPREYLKLCGEITGMGKKEIQDKTEELLDTVGLPQADKRIRGFSRGMKQRLGIAQALLHSPRLLICDEPTSALDPVGRKEILDILLSLRKHTTILFSTHILSDVERICDKVGLLHAGKIALAGTIQEIRGMRGSDGFEAEFGTEEEAGKARLLFPGGQAAGYHVVHYAKKSAEDMAAFVRVMADSGIYPLRVQMKEAALETLFMEVVGQ